MKQLLILSIIIMSMSCGGNDNEVPKKDTTVTKLPAETVPTDNQYKDTIKRDPKDTVKNK
jgi:hypothetical protein